MAKVVRVHQTGGPEVLRLEEFDVGEPKAGEVRIKVEAFGLNRAEAIFRTGKYLTPVKVPTLMGYEACGILEALGEGVQGFKAGDRVCVLPSYRLGEYGVYGETAIVPARSLLAPPPGLSPVEAASIWMQYFTAYGIVEVAKVSLGDHVLIPAASSSVGLAAIQLTNWAGGVSVALTRSSAKAAALKEQGAQHVIATGETDLVAEVMRITQNKGARIIFDPVGGPGIETLAKAASDEGIIFQYGGLSGQPTPYPHWSAAMKSLSIRGWIASFLWNHPERFNRTRERILLGLAGGHLKPVIAKVFTLDQIVEAHRYLESNQQVGKIVVKV
jgi:NADPH:quinone reductase-like Zn-dependent oxidoreductase